MEYGRQAYVPRERAGRRRGGAGMDGEGAACRDREGMGGRGAAGRDRVGAGGGGWAAGWLRGGGAGRERAGRRWAQSMLNFHTRKSAASKTAGSESQDRRFGKEGHALTSLRANRAARPHATPRPATPGGEP
jgi:hypothetical protein